MTPYISKDFNRRGSGHTAAVRMSVIVFTGLILLASAVAVLV
jgi:hypothetical protein